MTIPTGWQRIAIKEVYEGLFDGPHATPPTADEGPVFLGIKNITDDGQLLLSEVRYIAEDDFPRWTRRVTPQAGDIVFTYEATLNRYAIIPPDFRGCLGRRLALIRPNVEVVDGRFLHYYFFSRDWRETIEANKLAGATVDRVPLTHFPDFPINLPPLPTQRSIASILSTYDDLIVNNMRRIEILEEMARRLYEEWFVHFRFPGHEDVTFTEAEHGQVPEGWEPKTLGTLVEIKKGKNITKKTIVPGDVPVVAGGRNPAYYHNAANTVEPVVTVSASGANAGFVRLYQQDVWASDCSYIDASATPHVHFFYLLLKYHQSDVTRMQKGSAQPHVYPADLMELPVVEAPLGIIEQLHSIVSPQFALIKNLDRKNTTLRAQRDLLLPKLVSGEIDVSEAEENLGDTAA